MRTHIESISGKGPSSIESFILAPPANHEHLGSVTLLADFTDLPESLRYLGATVAGSVQRVYYANESGQSPQQRFAKALRAANLSLAEEAKTSTAQWVGTLKAVVGVVADNTVFLSHTGGCAAFFLRNGTVTEIPMEAGEGSRPFGSLTSGALQTNDEIILAPRTILGITDVPTALASNPKRFFAAVRHAESLTCLRIVALQGRTPTSVTIRAILPRTIHLSRLSHLPQTLSKMLTFFSALLQAIRQKGFALPSPKNLRLPAASLPIPRRHVLMIAAPAALIGITLMLAAVMGENRDGQHTTASALEAAQDALERSETKVILGENASAIAILTEAIAALPETADADLERLRKELVDRKNTLAGITAVQPETVLAFAGFPLALDPQHVALIAAPEGTMGPFIALSGSQQTALWINDTLSETGGTFLFLPPPLRSGILDVTTAPNDLFLVATVEGFAAVSAKERSAIGVLATQSPPKILAPSGSGAFALLPETGTVQLLTIDTNGIPTAHAWLKGTNQDIVRARDAAMLHGDLLVLRDDNTFVRYRNSRRAGLYRIEGWSWEGDARAFTAIPNGGLAVLDSKNGRVLLTNDKGDIATQLEHSSFVDARDIAISPDGTSLYVLTSTSLLKLAMNGSE